MPISISMRPLSTRFWVGEEIAVELVIRNNGPATEVVPDPAYMANKTPIYRLTGPAHPAGVAFRMSGLVENAQDVDTAIAEPLHVYPGTARSLAVPVSMLLPIRQPGIYEISAYVAGIASPPVQFELFQPLERKVALERVEDVAEASEVNAAWLLRSPQGGVIVRRTYPHPIADEMLTPERTERVAEVGAGCSAPICAGVPSGVAGRGWVLYFDGPKLFAAARGMAETVELELPANIRAIVDSPVTLASGAVDALVLTEAQTLSRVRFFPAPEPVWPEPLPETDDVEENEEEDDSWDLAPVILPTPPPVVSWTGSLAARPHSVAAISAEPGGQRLVYVYESSGGLVFRHLVLSEAPEPPIEGSAFLPDASAIPGSAPHLYIGANGRTQIASLVLLHGPGAESSPVALAELCFDRSGVVRLGEETAVTTLCDPVAAPVCAAIDSFHDQSSRRLDWLIGLASGKVLRGAGRNPAREVNTNPIAPLQLRSLAHVALLPVAGGPAGCELQPI